MAAMHPTADFDIAMGAASHEAQIRQAQSTVLVSSPAAA